MTTKATGPSRRPRCSVEDIKSDRRIIIVIAVTILATVMVCVGVYRSLLDYELTLSESGGAIEVHTLQLGEYYTPVQELTIKDSDHHAVLRLTAKGENSRLHTIKFESGRNASFDMYIDGYLIDGAHYQFKKGEEYSVSVSWPSESANITFSLK